MQLSVVIPALNERENLAHLLPVLREVASSVAPVHEIVVVDGGSTDGTPEEAVRHGARVLAQVEPGFGRAIWEGLHATRGEWVLTLDADGSHDPWYLPSLYARRGEADVIIASRYVPCGGSEGPAYRGLLSRLLNRVASWACSIPVRDSSGGFKLYRRSMFEEFALTSRDFNVQLEATILAIAHGYRVIEVPYTYKPRRTGASHAKVLRYGLSFARSLFRIWRMRNTVLFCDYDERAFRSRIPLQKYWHRSRYRILKRLMEDMRPTLDAGCGSAHFILAHPEIVGLDADRRKARFIRTCHRRTVVGSIRHLPFRSGSLAQVVSSEVIEHIPNKRVVLSELTRVIRPGGVLLVSTPEYGRGLWEPIERIYKLLIPGGYADEHISRFRAEELQGLLIELGMEIEHVERMLASILFMRARKRSGPAEKPQGGT
ncbi:MAG: glycosyltransferase [Candidatus Rokubacteria bacterium]|nr:glycosyltransferase [Candidatus Rokubacteria bacterium]